MELAKTLIELDQHNEALELVTRAKHGFEQVLGPDNQETIAAAEKLAKLRALDTPSVTH